MKSNKPYLLRAFYQWIVDSECTPILVIDANHPRSKIPADYADDGEIVFNISPNAVRDLRILNDIVEFKASFSGIIHIISASMSGILAVYAEENEEGLYFDPAEEDDSNAPVEFAPLKSVSSSNEAIVKDDMEGMEQLPPSTPKVKPFLKLVE